MQDDGLRLRITRSFPATRECVVGHFTDGALLARWWGPDGFSVPSLDFAPRAGATYRIEMQPPEGPSFALMGTFLDVALPSRLAFSFRWEPPDPDDQDTMVELTFRDAGESTEVALIQGPFTTEARRSLHRDGWAESFDRLRSAISRAGP